jgi:predicted nuclease with TOPRIM domain
MSAYEDMLKANIQLKDDYTLLSHNYSELIALKQNIVESYQALKTEYNALSDKYDNLGKEYNRYLSVGAAHEGVLRLKTDELIQCKARLKEMNEFKIVAMRDLKDRYEQLNQCYIDISRLSDNSLSAIWHRVIEYLKGYRVV